MKGPDLAKFGCKRLEMDFACDIRNQEATRIFGQKFSPSLRWSYFAYQEYSGERNKHSCSLLVHHRTKRPGRKKAKLHLHLSFKTGEARELTLMRAKLDPALDFLGSHPELILNKFADVSARFIYAGEKYEPFPSLPTPHPAAGPGHWEVIGLRISVKENATSPRPRFTIVVEKIPDGGVHHFVTFRYKISNVARFGPDIVSLCAVISKRFVIEKGVRQP